MIKISVTYVWLDIKDLNKSNTQKYFRHSNIKRYELALLRSGYFIYFGRLYLLLISDSALFPHAKRFFGFFVRKPLQIDIASLLIERG